MVSGLRIAPSLPWREVKVLYYGLFLQGVALWGLCGLDVFRSCPWGPGSGRPYHPRPVAFGLAEEAGVVCEYRAPPPAKFWVKSWKLHASKF